MRGKRGKKPGSVIEKFATPAKMVVPDPPAELGEYGQAYWRELAPLLIELGMLTPVHLSSFRVLCEQWEIYRKLSIWLDADPDRMCFVTESGYMQETPQVRQRDKALASMQRLWMKFGLTPHALSQLTKRGVAAKQLPRIADFAKKKYGS